MLTGQIIDVESLFQLTPPIWDVLFSDNHPIRYIAFVEVRLRLRLWPKEVKNKFI
jgi:hypothetical protein